MRVRDKDFGCDSGQRLEVSFGGVEGRQRGQVVHVADVLAQPRVLPVGDRQGVLQIATDGQRRRHRHRQRHRQRRVAAGPPDRAVRPHLIGVSDTLTTRTTESSQGTRMARSCISQPSARCESRCERIVVGEADRFAAEIARRHHQHGRARLVAGQPEQQCVQRRVGQHHAEVGVVRCHRCGNVRRVDRGISTMGRCGPDSSRSEVVVDLGDARARWPDRAP